MLYTVKYDLLNLEGALFAKGENEVSTDNIFTYLMDLREEYLHMGFVVDNVKVEGGSIECIL